MRIPSEPPTPPSPSMTASNRKRPKIPAIVVPKPADEQPRFGRIGTIAAIGFVLGVAWPGLARVQLVPQPPGEAKNPLASPSSSAPGIDSAQAAASAGPLRAAPAASKDIGPRVRLADIISCVDADGRKRRKCDAPSLDPVLVEPLKGLLACDGAEGHYGMLSLGFDLDFGSGQVASFTVGRSTTLDASLARSLAECAKEKLTQFDVSAVEHNFASYRLFYLVEFVRPAADDKSSASPESAPTEPTNSDAPEGELLGQSGRATVTWDVAIVRKAPKDGDIVARVLGGTRVVVTGRQGDWYRIKYDAKGEEGFVFKSAIGL